MNIDFEKAFDSVKWDLVQRALNFFNFPEKLNKWIQTFYTNIETCMIYNGNASPFCQTRKRSYTGLFIIPVPVHNSS